MRHLIYGLLLLTSTSATADYPLVLDPVATATPPGATVSAGYFSLTNQGDKNIRITDSYSPDVARVEIHLSTVVNDVAKMEKQTQVEIPPGQTLKFEHGSYHIMFMDLAEPLVENTTIDLVLVTSVGDMLIEMQVKKMSDILKSHSTHDNKKHSDTLTNHSDNSLMSEGESKEPDKVVH